jgi:hypothetical protein
MEFSLFPLVLQVPSILCTHPFHYCNNVGEEYRIRSFSPCECLLFFLYSLFLNSTYRTQGLMRWVPARLNCGCHCSNNDNKLTSNAQEIAFVTSDQRLVVPLQAIHLNVNNWATMLVQLIITVLIWMYIAPNHPQCCRWVTKLIPVSFETNACARTGSVSVLATQSGH